MLRGTRAQLADAQISDRLRDDSSEPANGCTTPRAAVTTMTSPSQTDPDPAAVAGRWPPPRGCPSAERADGPVDVLTSSSAASQLDRTVGAEFLIRFRYYLHDSDAADALGELDAKCRVAADRLVGELLENADDQAARGTVLALPRLHDPA